MKNRIAISALASAALAWQKTLQSSGPAFALTLGLTFVPTAGMAAEPVLNAKVGAYAKHVGSKIVYYYRVTNTSQRDITAVSIGHDTLNDNDPGNDVWELLELPSGWNPNPKVGIPSASSNSPTGWRVSMTTPAEGSEKHAITWEIINNKSPVISPWQTQAKMSIALDKADASYLSGHALVTFSDATPGANVAPVTLSVPVEPLDHKPPTLSVALSPGVIHTVDGKHVPVNMTFAVKEDDYDNQPEIKLESVTANEPLQPGDVFDASFGLDDRHLRLRAITDGDADRIYTVTYSATDASGNQAFASATVTVSRTPVAVSPIPTPVPPIPPAVAPK